MGEILSIKIVMYRSIIKNIIDFILALLGLIMLSPVFLAVWFCLLVANDGKPFFFQLRPGKDKKLFYIIKFKTMNDRKDAKGVLLADHLRLTKIGSFVRKTSLDELPQLINVLKGDMSLIGPRPLLPEYLPLYSIAQNRRHEVKPGITGWAQVNGRNAINWDEKFKLDVWYVDHLSFGLDFRIIMLTLKKVLVREGISSPTSVTMEKFKGN